jgi:hypothetical protein
LAVAASLLVMLQLWGGGGGGGTGGPGGNVLGSGIEILQPPPGTDRWTAIEWSAPEGWEQFEVWVYDPEGDGEDELQDPVRVEGRRRLELDPEVTSTWPETILVEIDALDPSGGPDPLDSEVELLSLSSR